MNNKKIKKNLSELRTIYFLNTIWKKRNKFVIKNNPAKIMYIHRQLENIINPFLN